MGDSLRRHYFFSFFYLRVNLNERNDGTFGAGPARPQRLPHDFERKMAAAAATAAAVSDVTVTSFWRSINILIVFIASTSSILFHFALLININVCIITFIDETSSRKRDVIVG